MQDVISGYEMPSSLQRRVMPYEHNGSSYFIACYIYGTVLHR